LQEKLRQKAMEDLDIDVIFEPRGSAAVLQKAVMVPNLLMYLNDGHIASNHFEKRDLFNPLTKKLQYWDKINPLCRTGRLSAEANLGAGDLPYEVLHVQPAGKLGTQHNEQISSLPYVHNVDSFGYNTNIIRPGEPYKT
jgi:putative spermidine/putrescine transport system substrate-binding protein